MHAEAEGEREQRRRARVHVPPRAAEGARGERHTQVIALEVYELEHQLHAMSEELDDAQRQARRHEAAAAADREEVEHVRAELKARHEEQGGLVGRLATAQRVNEEWHERVRTVSAEFDATAAEWPAKLSSFSAADDAHARFSWYDATERRSGGTCGGSRSSAARAAIATGSGSRFGT